MQQSGNNSIEHLCRARSVCGRRAAACTAAIVGGVGLGVKALGSVKQRDVVVLALVLEELDAHWQLAGDLSHNGLACAPNVCHEAWCLIAEQHRQL